MLSPIERQRRERELRDLQRRYAKDMRKSLNDAVARAKAGYQQVNDAQSELDDEYQELAEQEGRLPAADYQKRLEELNARQARLDQSRNRHRNELLNVGERIDELEDDPDGVIDRWFAKYPALSRPTRNLSW